MRKTVAFIADSLDNAYKFQQVLASCDVAVSAGTTPQMSKLFAPACDLVVFEARGVARERLREVEALCEEHACDLLVIVEEENIDMLGYPADIAYDFVLPEASEGECAARVRRLLHEPSPVEESAEPQLISIDSMTINFDTYQVRVSGEPIDFTYLEYALLAFLISHPNHTFTRDQLLQHVWGFDYYGGSRTVDVHVRRIRAKLGPELAQRLATVRGVGYLWKD